MRSVDIKNLIHFQTRTGMFIWPVDRRNAVSFISGYEYAAGGECQYTKRVSEYLSGHYGVRYGERMAGPNRTARRETFARLDGDLFDREFGSPGRGDAIRGRAR